MIVALVGGRLVVPPSADSHPRALDPIGALLPIAGLVALVYAIIEAPSNGWLSAVTLGTGSLGATILAAWVAWELRSSYWRPLPPLRSDRWQQLCSCPPGRRPVPRNLHPPGRRPVPRNLHPPGRRPEPQNLRPPGHLTWPSSPRLPCWRAQPHASSSFAVPSPTCGGGQARSVAVTSLDLATVMMGLAERRSRWRTIRRTRRARRPA